MEDGADTAVNGDANGPYLQQVAQVQNPLQKIQIKS
jgi:hypothetical protein